MRRAIVVCIVAIAAMTVAVSIRERSVDAVWTNTTGFALGALAGTYIGEQLERFGERVAATKVAWIQMAVIAFLIVAVVSWKALPAYCQLPLTFLEGAVVAAAMVYIERLRMQRS